jgi:hypothetical protein
VVTPADELRHAPGPDASWNERWYFDVVAPDRSWGLYAQLTLLPNVGRAEWWSLIVRAGEPLLLVRDDTLDLPRASSFEVRGSGLWADLTCHRAMQRWQVNFEGITVALDDPADVHRYERGDLVPVEFEFEWEAAGDWTSTRDGYLQRCEADGEADIRGGRPLKLTHPAAGLRTHEWGARTP